MAYIIKHTHIIYNSGAVVAAQLKFVFVHAAAVLTLFANLLTCLPLSRPPRFHRHPTS